MASTVSDAAMRAALDEARDALDRLVELGVEPVDGRDALAVIAEVEALARRVRALQLEVVEAVDRKGLHKADGHASAKVMVRHVANLSEPEAGRRAKAARALRDLPQVLDALRAGKIGACQVDRIARVHANPRVRERLCRQDASLAEYAATTTYRVFDRLLDNWVRMVDEDGTCDRSQRCHENRDFRVDRDFDGAGRLVGGCGGLDRAELASIHDRFVDAEFAADWAAARAEHGDGATVDHLARTDAQRRFDALLAIFRRAAAAQAGDEGGSVIVTNVVVDQETFERRAARLAGAAVAPRGEVGLDGRGAGSDFRSADLDGAPVDPTEAVASALIGRVRRVVLGADSVTIDLGRTRRLFGGPAQLAVRLGRDTCYWPGCHVPVTQCQSDHLLPWDAGGRTDPGNGGPACGKHNRYRQHGFAAERDTTGTWHVRRPDGTEIPGCPHAA